MKIEAITELTTALFVAITLIGIVNRKDNTKTIKWLIGTNIAMISYLIVDGLAYILMGPEYPHWFLYVLNFLAYVSGAIIIIFFVKYSEEYFKERTSIKSWILLIPIALATAYGVFAAVEYFMGNLVTFDNGMVIDTPNYPLYLRVLQVAAMICVPIVAIIYKNVIGGKAVFLYCLYIISPALAALIAALTGYDFTTVFGAASLILITTLLHRDELSVFLEKMNGKLSESNELLEKELRRNDILHDIIHSGKWILYVSAFDEILESHISEEASRIVNNNITDNGLSWLEIVHPDDREATKKAFFDAIKDHTCKTPYDVKFRMADKDGNYRWFNAAGRMVRNEDGTGEFFGIHVDITEQMEEQEKRLLGAIPLSSDILSKTNIGMWAFEIDENKAPRMYVDETMRSLLGLDHQLTPENTYHAWYDYIDDSSYGLVMNAIDNMKNGKQTEVQYLWHNPKGKTMKVRSGGVRNYEYTKGIRIEGTHEDITILEV